MVVNLGNAGKTRIAKFNALPNKIGIVLVFGKDGRDMIEGSYHGNVGESRARLKI